MAERTQAFASILPLTTSHLCTDFELTHVVSPQLVSTGLGTSTPAEAQSYFRDLDRHVLPFKYNGPEDDERIEVGSALERLRQGTLSLVRTQCPNLQSMPCDI